MCGIAGWIDFKRDLSKEIKQMEAMANTLIPRGPDTFGYWLTSDTAFAHRRLAVVDIEGGKQPMVKTIEGYNYILIYNGELYNTEDLRKELISLGYSFSGHSDTEVLLVSYIQWGTDCLDKLNGIFAFAIKDERRNIVFLARDRFGVKPLFYTLTGSSLIFGSELKALLAHRLVKSEIGAEGLAEIFALGPARTPGHGVFKGINELKPAHYMIFNKDGLKIQKYWSFVSRTHTDSIEDTIEHVEYLVKDSIRRQLVSDVPVCTFLSGGLDSSAITALAAMDFHEEGKGRLHTFSIDYVDNDLYFRPSAFQPNSDAYWIKRMSGEFNSIHHCIKFDTNDIADALTDAVKARDLPGMADIDSSLLLFCREIKKFATVALSGECADEIFGGYPWFHRDDLLNADTFPWSVSLSERTKVFSNELIEMIKPYEYVKQRYLETLNEVPALQGEDPLEARRREVFYLNITWFMSNLLDRKDRMSMASGLEVRVPYCDHRLAEYVWNIPWHMKAYNGREKGLLRKALKGTLPDDIIERKKSPYPKTHNPAYEKAVGARLIEILNDKSSPLLPLVNKKQIEYMISSKSDYGKPWFGQLMAAPQMFAFLIQVDFWLREYKVTIV